MKSLHTAFSFAPPSILSLTICDDDNLRIEIFKNSIDRYLKEHGDGGYTLTTYTSGKPLIDDVSDGEWYDIIILDVSINGENGIEIAKRLRKIGYYGNITFWTERKEYVFDALDVSARFITSLKALSMEECIQLLSRHLKIFVKKRLLSRTRTTFTELNYGILNTSKARTNT